VDSVEIRSRYVHRHRAGAGDCCDLGNRGRIAVSFVRSWLWTPFPGSSLGSPLVSPRFAGWMAPGGHGHRQGAPAAGRCRPLSIPQQGECPFLKK
jgi:hypothetical protein